MDARLSIGTLFRFFAAISLSDITSGIKPREGSSTQDCGEILLRHLPLCVLSLVSGGKRLPANIYLLGVPETGGIGVPFFWSMVSAGLGKICSEATLPVEFEEEVPIAVNVSAKRSEALLAS